jgi:hypothetical protein
MSDAKRQSDDPQSMIAFLTSSASDRKIRLFACACCRQFPNQAQVIADAVAIAEVYADTQRTKAALKRARDSVKAIRHQIRNDDKARYVEWAALWLTEVAASENAAGGVGSEVIRLTSRGMIPPEVQSSLCSLVHDVMAPRPIPTDAAWITPVSASLAQSMYDARRFDRMRELVESLEQAGCGEKDILDHCRGPGPHVRGCWVVDLLLGKK